MTVRASALKVEHVGIRFGGLVALSDLNFTVDEGEIVSLIGPNGAGKTTAFNIVTGFLPPTHGSVSYRGTALNGLKPHEIADIVKAVTGYVARRLIERERALDEDPEFITRIAKPEAGRTVRRRRRGRLGALALGFVLGVIALLLVTLLLASRL